MFSRCERDKSLVSNLHDDELAAITTLNKKPELLEKYKLEEERRQRKKELESQKRLVYVAIFSLLVTAIIAGTQIFMQSGINTEQNLFSKNLLVAFDKLATIEKQAQYKNWKIYSYFEDINENKINAEWRQGKLHFFGFMRVYNIGTLPVIFDYPDISLVLNCDKEENERRATAEAITRKDTLLLPSGEYNRYRFDFEKQYQKKPQNCVLFARIKMQHPIEKDLSYHDINAAVKIN